jgi:hypothetical protein
MNILYKLETMVSNHIDTEELFIEVWRFSENALIYITSGSAYFYISNVVYQYLAYISTWRTFLLSYLPTSNSNTCFLYNQSCKSKLTKHKSL